MDNLHSVVPQSTTDCADNVLQSTDSISRQTNTYTTTDIEKTQKIHPVERYESTSSSFRCPPAETQSPSKKRSRFSSWQFKIPEKGESGRRYFNFKKFIWISFKSSSKVSQLCNVLWPVVPVAITNHFVFPDKAIMNFILDYFAMVPCANLIGFASQQMALKLPHVWGILVESTMGSIVEVIMFMILLRKDYVIVIQAAILGSILATMLLCMGLCFLVGGLVWPEQKFSKTVSETASMVLLTSTFALAIPCVFKHSLTSQLEEEVLSVLTINISRVLAVMLIVTFCLFLWFQTHTHHSIYTDVYRNDKVVNLDDPNVEKDRERLTLTESILALVISTTLVSFIALSLVEGIEPIVEISGISDPFLGLILVPLIEKFSKNLTTINEAYEDQMNHALSHILGATVQTSLFTGPLVVLVGWVLQSKMSFDFAIFEVVILVFAILIVSGFLRDQRSNYMEGFLLLVIYTAMGVAAFYYPNPHHGEDSDSDSDSDLEDEPVKVAHKLLTRLLRA